LFAKELILFRNETKKTGCRLPVLSRATPQGAMDLRHSRARADIITKRHV
jgi:hypothetical protein